MNALIHHYGNFKGVCHSAMLILTDRQMLAREFVYAFEAVAAVVGKERALADPRVQAARARYRAACA